MERGILVEASAREGVGTIKSDGRLYTFSVDDAPSGNDSWIGKTVEFEVVPPRKAVAIRLVSEDDANG